MTNCSGKVYLVGAGPGKLDYLTLRGYQLIQSAEVIVYDALVDEQILELAPSNCLKLPVGKRGGKPSTPQGEINQLLVKYCLQNKQVVRLKGGDPLIFGRARPEVEALNQAGCNFELVPGISSALAAPLLSGIPLTDKDLSSVFAVFSAHKLDLLDWEALAKLDTLVILMGGRNLNQIVQKLLQQGKSTGFPIAIIRNCGRSQTQIWRGTLGNIVEQTKEISLSPAVIIIGEVVNLQPNFQSSKTQETNLLPLLGKTILVTRAAGQSSTFSALLQQQGAQVIEMPTLEIRPPSSWFDLDRAICSLKQPPSAIASLTDFHWLILTSSNGVEYFWRRLTEKGKDARALAGIKIAVVGKKTASALQKYGLTPDFIPPNFVADSLAENFPESLQSKKILFPRVETGGRPILVKELTSAGAEVVEVAAYESACPQAISPQAWDALQQQQIDIITFASSKTVANFNKLWQQALETHQLTNQSAQILKSVAIASIGPQTSQTCHNLFGRVDIEAQEYTLEGLTTAIVNWLGVSH